ncbi:unnamed protein product [Caenorhabditis auriculariae]|uniref:Uncharacterized protein n=1 Tax=Caenorhabditis auriculariae TaxID=2777116 RepID=A0A8S1H8Y0_9PELO|nr:unnamed protein product [Caenorhabditis auriculariae]
MKPLILEENCGSRVRSSPRPNRGTHVDSGKPRLRKSPAITHKNGYFTRASLLMSDTSTNRLGATTPLRPYKETSDSTINNTSALKRANLKNAKWHKKWCSGTFLSVHWAVWNVGE